MINKLIHSFSIFSPIIPILLFIVLKHNQKVKVKWVIFYLLCVGLTVDVFSYRLSLNGTNTQWLINTFTIIEFSLLSYFFFLLFAEKKLQQLVKVIYILFTAGWCVRNIVLGKLAAFDVILQTIEFIILLCFCIIYLFQQVQQTETVVIYSTFEFWLIASMLMYCAATFFSFLGLMFYSSSADNLEIKAIEYISRLSNIIRVVFVIIAFTMKPIQEDKNIQYYYTPTDKN